MMVDEPARSGGGWWRFVPAIAAVAVLAAFLSALGRKDLDVLPSPLIAKPAPQFDLPPLREGGAGLTTADLTAGEATVVNVWSSWCGPCRAEHPELERLAAMGQKIYGINYKDKRENALRFLDDMGDPYARIGADRKGRASIDWGVYGVPETFIISGTGEIVYKHVGPIQNGELETKILPALEKARAETK